MDECHHAHTPCTISLYILFVLFGISGNLATNSLWIQLPILMSQVPEESNLTIYLITILEFGHIATIAYLLVRRYASHRLSEIPFIYSSYALSLTALFLTALLGQTQTQLGDTQHSFILMICALLAALVSCMFTVTYIPYAGGIRSQYVTAVLLGNVLASFIPHIMALGQGVSESPDCTDYWSARRSNITSDIARLPNRGYGPTTTPSSSPILMPKTRFDEKFYYYTMAGWVFLSGIAFIAARHLSSRVPAHLDDDIWHGHCDGGVLDDGSVRHEYHHQQHHQHNGHSQVTPQHSDEGSSSRPPIRLSGENFHNSPLRQMDTVSFSGGRGHSPASMRGLPPPDECTQLSRDHRLNSEESQGHSSGLSQYTINSHLFGSSPGGVHGQIYDNRPPFFPLLIIITFWATMICHGPLSSVKSHACSQEFPIGNKYFIGGVLVTNAVQALACPVSLKLYSRSRITVVVALTSLATITLAYFAALIGFNVTMGSGDSLVFESTGELLGTIAWVTVVGLFYLALSTIGAMCAESGEEYIMWYAAAFQIGTAVGTLFLLDDINICQMYRIMNACAPTSSPPTVTPTPEPT